MLAGIWTYVRRHHLALAALFIALGGTGYAASKLATDGASKKFGSSVYFGSINNFGPVTDNGIGNGIPLIGRIDTNLGSDASGGPHLLVAPVALRLRDLSFKADFPVERPVRLRFFKGDSKGENVLLGCKIPAGKKACADRGPSSRLPKGKPATAEIDAPPIPGTLSEHDYQFAYRIVPG